MRSVREKRREFHCFFTTVNTQWDKYFTDFLIEHYQMNTSELSTVSELRDDIEFNTLYEFCEKNLSGNVKIDFAVWFIKKVCCKTESVFNIEDIYCNADVIPENGLDVDFNKELELKSMNDLRDLLSRLM